MDAFVSGRAGVAIIVDGDRLLSMSLEAHAPPTPCTTRDVRFLLGDARDLLIVEGKTMDEIRAHLMVARDHDDALQLTLFTLDAELSDDTREESALALEELLARDGVLELVEGVLLSRPVPDSADLKGAKRLAGRASADTVERLFESVASSATRIEAVWRAWEALPSSLFGDEVERARMRAVFVRAGVFKALVDGDVDAAAVAVRVPAADEYEAILQTWIRSLKDDSRVPRRFRYEPTHPAPTADLEQGRGLEAREGMGYPALRHEAQEKGSSTGREPMVFLAFADSNPAKPLRNLSREEKAIRDALEQLVKDGKLDEPKTLWNATVDGIIGELRSARFHGRFRVFHFGGHANSTEILAGDEGAQAPGRASGLAEFLGRQEGLTLVVLNGCSTQAQVHRLRNAGVGAVIATRRAIMDDVAADFATQLYAELSIRPLKAAFEAASAAVRIRRGQDPRELVQEDLVVEEEWAATWPWVLACSPELEEWRLV